MTHAVPVIFQMTRGQRLQRAGAMGFVALVTIAALTQFFAASDRPTTHRIAIGLIAFALPAVSGYTGLAQTRVVADRDGILVTTRSGLSTKFMPWTQISHVQTRRRFGRTRVMAMTLSGAKIMLPVPYSGPLLERNPWFSESTQAIRILKHESWETGSGE
ncbi:hypothetical protein GCM10010168_33540 [Actinoplanes ianthinogenes]|uniref:PH domain-containing protein n=1 Tax=Actinoplanes ianthinogenes TaxID=122358 RepID=UPI00166F9123|nr:PH domain-containing protein [Actinoplanes ianthinogenes]GGR13056.1 hypothetical protein GCM10010168_33540 [Actinoplanes ianthinogenes]